MEHTSYHGVLRIAALLFAFMLIFDSGYLIPVTKQLSQNTQYYVANVIGIGAAVNPTELNTLTAELTSRQHDLDARESNIVERELSIGMNVGQAQAKTDISTYILSVFLFIILVLIALNYALDFAREKHMLAQAQS